MGSSVYLIVLSVATAGNTIALDDGDKDIRNSVVRVHATQRLPDMDRPWNKHAGRETAGSGVVIEGNRILTSAHVVLYANTILIEPHPSGEKVAAKVAALAPTLDLALLKLDDDAFFKEHPPLAIDSSLPKLQDTVSVYGFPLGGSGLSITKGIVSRIEFVGSVSSGPFPIRFGGYTEPSLYIQIDAALNPGNSGGPALVDGRVIGIVQSTLSGAEKIGYLLAGEEVTGFLKEQGSSESTYAGKLRFFDEWQPLENRALRTKLAVDKETKGVVIRKTSGVDDDYPLKEWDVITRIGQHAIDNAGMVSVHDDLRLRFDYFVSKLARDDAVPLQVAREGRTIELKVPLRREKNLLLRSLRGKYPSYFVYGPMVFETATSEYVDSGGPPWADLWSRVGSPLIVRRYDNVSFDGEELVVVASQLPHAITAGYANHYTQAVTQVNEVRIRNLRHLVETLRDSQDQFLVFRFAEPQAETLVLDRRETLAVTDEILSDNGIRQQGSDDMLDVWKSRGRQ
jgi:S1-C subfamily serine protease